MRIPLLFLAALALAQDPGHTNYSTLSQVDRLNVKLLKQAWSMPGATSAPLYAGGQLFLATAGALQALEPASGKPLWRCECGAASSGLAYWSDGKKDGARRVLAAAGTDLLVVDAQTGRVLKTIAAGAELAPPAVFENVVVASLANGWLKAWDVLTGEALWQAEDEQTELTVDAELGLIFTGSAASIDPRTGAVKWRARVDAKAGLRQAPSLIRLWRDGTPRRCLAFSAARGGAIILDREDGAVVQGAGEGAVAAAQAWDPETSRFYIGAGGTLAAHDLKQGTLAWQMQAEAGAGALVTQGGLLWLGSKVYDKSSGRLLWEAPSKERGVAPLAYFHNNKQYIVLGAAVYALSGSPTVPLSANPKTPRRRAKAPAKKAPAKKK